MADNHSKEVRSYTVSRIHGKNTKPEALEELIDECNRESGLHIQLVRSEPMAFGGGLAYYGKFSGVRNYLVLVGKKEPKLDKLCGRYGERIVRLPRRRWDSTPVGGLTFKKVSDVFQVAEEEWASHG